MIELDRVPVAYGKLTHWGNTSTLPVKLERTDVEDQKVVALIASVCRCAMSIDPTAGEPDQQTMLTEPIAELDGLTVVVGGVSGSRDKWSFSVTIDEDELTDDQLDVLRRFAASWGYMSLERIGDAPEARGRPRKDEEVYQEGP